MSILHTFGIYIGISAIGVLPGLIFYSVSWRRRKVAEAELSMVGALIEYEKMMRDGVISQGEACHDLIYQGINRALRARMYRMSFVELIIGRIKRAAVLKQVSSELESGDPKLKRNFERFSTSYFKAFRFSRPGSAAFFVVSLLCTAAFLNGVLMSLQLALNGIVGVVTGLTALKLAWLQTEKEIAAGWKVIRGGMKTLFLSITLAELAEGK